MASQNHTTTFLMGKHPLQKQVPCGDNSSVSYSAINGQNANCTGHVMTISGELERVYHGDIWTPEVIQRIVTLAVIMVRTKCAYRDKLEIAGSNPALTFQFQRNKLFLPGVTVSDYPPVHVTPGGNLKLVSSYPL